MLMLAQLVNALVIGTLYALMSLGLSLIFGVLKLVNFAHGESLMVGGYLYLFLASFFLSHSCGLPLPLALITSMAAVFVFGLILERLFLRSAYERKTARYDEYVILVTFTLGIFLQNLALPLFGPYNRQAPAIFTGRIKIGDLVIAGDRISAAVIAFLIIALLLFFLYRTYLGKGLRAVAQNPDAASILGISVARMRGMAFGIGISLAGVAGALLGPIFLVNPGMGVPFAIKAFVIVVLGGMGSIKGTIIGAFILAMVENFGSILLPDPTRALAYKDAYGLLLLILTLLFRPQGLFGEKERRA
ncbi:branched-chain amino acid ABC transporter permease [Desulfoferrobacter suflitae]|uniref:branched-chain amino acid ABC transporter permease n=1 Tax=Desulfoferrobacter suflitae TaxID=2865782 RepID=UPI0021646ED6|nr:branched-chain amino acid ABC transporter permease [Desulfoferrobacter suflitae]MCK8602517.1 branched-chain amino acid ABC transporter permease [Desulfoferrobacter suflitae]